MLFLFFLLALAHLSFSVEVFSNRLERLPDGTFKAEGRVEVYYQNYYIEADFLTYDPQQKLVHAKGNVYVRSVDGRLEVRGSEALLDLEKEVGYFIDAEGRFEKFNFSAKRIDKRGEEYEVREGSITTCPQDRREMNLCFSRARITPRYVYAWNNNLRLFNFPIAYLPVGVFPVGERRSGLLPPFIGSNTYNSFIYQQPVYWAISKDKDLTLTFDLRERQAKGLSVEYRQSMRKELDMILSLSFYREPSPPGEWWQGRDPSTFRENRYRIKGALDLGDLKIGLDLLSDPYFMQDIYFSTRERTVPYASSYVSYKKESGRFLFTFDVRGFYDTTSSNNRRTLQRLPELGFYLKSIQLFPNLYFNLTASYANFYRQKGLRAHRILFFPEVVLQKNFLGMNFLSTLTVENLLYLDARGGRFSDTEVFGSVRYRESMPYFFNFKHGSLELRNLFELSYSYRPKTYKNPRFDRLDRIDRENLFSYTFRGYGYYRQRLVYNLFVEGGYDFNLSKGLVPLRAILGVYPTEWLTLSSDSTYDFERGRFVKSVSSVTFSSERGSLTLGRTFERGLSDQYNLRASAFYRGVNFTFGLVKDNRIKKDLQREANVEYRGACWSFGLLFRDLYDGTRQKYIKEVFLTFNVFDLQRFTVPLKR